MIEIPRPAYTALIVEDERAILAVLESVLDDAGFATTCYDCGQPALEALGQQHFNVLIVDQWLPDMNGLRICEAARECYGDTTAILMVTADRRRDHELMALETCVDDYVNKPFHLEELVARVKAKLRQAERNVRS